MRYTSRFRQHGFTLIELVIVLGITGLIFGGLWGLLSGGSSQLQAQSAAQQYRQVIEATKKFLANPPSGVGFDASTLAVGTPSRTALTVQMLVDGGALTANFASRDASNNYYDAFGHRLDLTIKKLDTTGQKWLFMVHSERPTATIPAISDKVGAQVASLIGAEGGFIYSTDTEGCLTGTAVDRKTCGAFNAFAFDVVTENFADAGSGRIATLSYTNDNTGIDALWLARTNALGVDFNTMQTDLYFSGSTNDIQMGGNSIYMKNDAVATGGGALSMAGGAITMNGGAINMATSGASSGGGALNMAAGEISNIQDMSGGSVTMDFQNTTMGVNQLTVNTNNNVTFNLGKTFNINEGPGFGSSPTDPPELVSINGLGKADTFQANRFIYDSTGSATSDGSLKKEVRPIVQALSHLLLLQGVHYNWKGNGRADLGFIAQDVQKVFPELVAESPGGKLGIDYGKMVAPVVEAIRDLKKENDELRQEIEELKKKIH